MRFVQLANSESARAWQADHGDVLIETAVDGRLDSVTPSLLTERLEQLLDRLKPDVIAIAGYADKGMRRAAVWARRRGAHAILLSDSQERDWPRRFWREWLKRIWVSRHFNAAFVSGAAAAFYAESLGIPSDRIWRGYDVVDNEHFSTQAGAIRAEADRWRESLNLPRHFFLYVGRLSPEKNLARLIEAFRVISAHPKLEDWALVLVGSGPIEEDLQRQAAALGSKVRFTGFQQLDRLPSYYGLASCLVLPSLSEPWGLVVNEAMAAGLPVVASQQCGCVMELVFPGVNGVIVDPLVPKSLEHGLMAIASNAGRREQYGAASVRIVENFSLDAWANALTECCLTLAGNSRAGATHG